MKLIETRVSPDGEITVECDFPQPPEKVWRAITEPALVAAWLGTPPVDAGARDATAYEIVEADPCRYLRYRWREDGEADTVVTFELAPREGGGTSFRLTHEPAAIGRRAANGNAPPLALAA